MKTSKRFILSIITLCLFSPTLTLRIRNNSDDARGLTASPTLIYRRRLNGGPSGRFKESIYPQTSPKSSLEQKTDAYPTISQLNSYSGETVEPNRYFTSSTPSSGVIPKSLRRNRSRLRSVISQESVEQELTTKPAKSKTSRRRKVKRPVKTKPIPSTKITADEELGTETSKTNSTGGGGDKNLALEIGSEDGKYALIDKFFEIKPPKAPGVISYAQSSDFKGDNQYTLGNVKENDIWLSEGHLLVLKGGDLDASLREHWKPIDNYQRGNRPPLRIALDSDNPPPFPVFINESGPPIFLGPPPPFGLPYPPPGGFNESFDPSRLPPPGLIPLFPNGTIPNYFGPPPPGAFGGVNNSLNFYPGPMGGNYGNGYGHGGGNVSFPLPYPPYPAPPGRFGNNSLPPPPPFFPFPPPPGNRNGSFPPPFFNLPPPGFNRTGGGPPPPGYPPFLPPLALNPNDNETDDPSIFLPPPYDFDYQDDNSTLVPPGPFAPGLVVPPPKNFYTVYNKTTRRPTFPPVTGLSYSFGKRPQRPNGKKPKFPITNPPDDSEEAYQPLTTPYPYHSEVPFKKRKQRPGKANKSIFPVNKYETESDIGKVSILQPTSLPIPEQVISQRPFVSIPLIQTPISTTIGTTSKPIINNNFVYVRGQLKSLAELEGTQEEEYEYEPTPRPPFDERGYPSRVIDDNEPLILQYNKKTTEVPAKSFYYNTPKYDAIYPTLPKKSKKQQQNRYYQNQNPDLPPSQSPIVQQGNPSLYFNPNNNRLGNQGQNLYGLTNNNFQEKITPVIDQTYYTRNNGQPQQTPQIIQLQSPKSYPVTRQRQPHLYNHANIPQNLNYQQPTSAFRPAFGPNTNNQQQSERSKILFPGQVTQSGPIFDFRTPLYQPQGRPQVDGYYSPVTQYYQPLHSANPVPVQQQDNNNYYQSPIGASQQGYFGSQNSNNRPREQIYQQKVQQPSYYSEQQGQSPGNNQELPNAYKSQLNQFVPQSEQTPLRQDVYVNYREPLPQYNTESEAVTTRTVFKAGPSQSPLTGAASSDGKPKTALINDGSYYSFQRGGPGGFSYKIQL